MGNLTSKVEKELGQVWRQMGIMYNQVSNSIKVLENVKTQTEGYVNRTGSNLGTMEGQVILKFSIVPSPLKRFYTAYSWCSVKVEGLADRMVDVDDNLNYMLGQLNLVVQEFNQVHKP